MVGSVRENYVFIFRPNWTLLVQSIMNFSPPNQNRHIFTSELHRADAPSLLHFAARYGFRSVSSLLLQCPGAERALHTANRHGQTPTEIAKSHGHTELHDLLKATLVTTSFLTICSSVYKDGRHETISIAPWWLMVIPVHFYDQFGLSFNHVMQ